MVGYDFNDGCGGGVDVAHPSLEDNAEAGGGRMVDGAFDQGMTWREMQVGHG